MQAASSLAGVLRALPPDGEQMLDAELEPGDVLQVLELELAQAREALSAGARRELYRCALRSCGCIRDRGCMKV